MEEGGKVEGGDEDVEGGESDEVEGGNEDVKGSEGGETDVAIVPGKPHESYLLELVVPAEGEPRPEMPPKDEPLTDYEVKLVRKWVEQGAKDDTPENAMQRFTMAKPPTYAVPPVVTSIAYSPDGKLLAMAARLQPKSSTGC